MSILFNVWMLPILFILHEFEEMIFVPLWKKRHHQKLMTFKKPFFGSVTQGSAFAVGVLEEFIILLFISGLCQMTHNTLLYLSFVIAYTSHFMLHYIMCLRFKGYVPEVVTASLELPVVLMLVFRYWLSDISLLPVIVYLFIAMAIAYTNLKVMHQIMPKIQLSLEKYIK